MADVTYKILIEAVNGGGAGGDSPRSTAITPSGEDVSPKTDTAASAVISYAKSAANVGLALKYASKVITTDINRVSLRTGRAMYQQQLNWTFSTATKTAGILAALAGALVTGNPLLAMAGMASALDAQFDYQLQKENIRLEKNVEDISIGMANIRAGAGGSRNSN